MQVVGATMSGMHTRPVLKNRSAESGVRGSANADGNAIAEHALSTTDSSATLARVAVEQMPGKGGRLANQSILRTADTRADSLGNNGVGSNAASSTDQSILATITQQMQQRFASQAGDKNAFHALLQKSFGDNYDQTKAESLRQRALNGDFSWMPKIKVVDGAAMTDISGQQGEGVALGAYGKDIDTIFLNRDLLRADPAKAEKILTEELGHALDARLNVNDAAGDEGNIFARLSYGESISTAELVVLRSENDTGTMIVDGKKVEIEYGWLKKLGRSISKGFKKIGRSIRKGISKIGESIKNTLKKILTSKLVGAVLTVAKFIPIPIVQGIAYALTLAKSAYSVYQGVKHGSIAAVLGGVAGLAGGVAKIGTAMGATGSWVGTARRIADASSSANKAYAAIAKKDFSAALSLISGRVSEGSLLTGALHTAQHANAVHQAHRNGDLVGAVSAGAALLQDFTGDVGDQRISQVDALFTAIGEQDVGASITLLRSITDGKHSALVDLLETGADLASRVRELDAAVDNGAYTEAADIAADLAGRAGNEKLQSALTELANVLSGRAIVTTGAHLARSLPAATPGINAQ